MKGMKGKIASVLLPPRSRGARFGVRENSYLSGFVC